MSGTCSEPHRREADCVTSTFSQCGDLFQSPPPSTVLDVTADAEVHSASQVSDSEYEPAKTPKQALKLFKRTDIYDELAETVNKKHVFPLSTANKVSSA